ncbi:hypothetical protein EVAR_20329_1 [Eumeta japonica]|uniref:Ionotropic receptor 75a N-terminal domain-containing protein n=1 Tax=Eumeta variegata TaxID=151549 RepID=A0A4C1VUJ2_EUMVA|nr:hypothetical protein EVAR_20329_1 [Eumeta japonica]
MLFFWFHLLNALATLRALEVKNRPAFVIDFATRRTGPANVVSLISNAKYNFVVSKRLFESGITYRVTNDIRSAKRDDHVIYVADIKDPNTPEILLEAETSKLLISPSRWLLFLDSNEFIDYTETTLKPEEPNNNDNIKTRHIESYKKIADTILDDVNVAINTEVYVAIELKTGIELFEVYRKQRHWPMIWDHNGSWDKGRGFRERPPQAVLAIRRKNMDNLPLTFTTAFTKNDTLKNMEEFKKREINTLSKYCYHMGGNIAEWLNATARVNITNSWGYRDKGDTYNGMVGELQTGRADVSGMNAGKKKERAGTVEPAHDIIRRQFRAVELHALYCTPFNPTSDRLKILEYVASPGPLTATFIFRRPALAAIGNIYLQPFSSGVWMATGVLLLISVMMLFFTTYMEPKYSVSRESKALSVSMHAKVPNFRVTMWERILDGLHDTLCLVFQQGTPKDPVSRARPTLTVTSRDTPPPPGRQILLMGLLAFMFLYTAYSAYVVALLQSSSAHIDSVDALSRSPLQLGLENVVYSKTILPNFDNFEIENVVDQKDARSFGAGLQGQSLPRYRHNYTASAHPIRSTLMLMDRGDASVRQHPRFEPTDYSLMAFKDNRRIAFSSPLSTTFPVFILESRPAHKALWRKKIVPQGDRAYYSLEMGIRRVREVGNAHPYRPPPPPHYRSYTNPC